MRLIPHLLRIDSLAGLTAGLIALSFSSWLAELYAVPRTYVLVNAAANLTYGSFSGWLARRPVRPLSLIGTLAGANLAWAIFCVCVAVWLVGRASVFGLAQLLFEAMFVGTLAALEWKHRHRLTVRTPA